MATLPRACGAAICWRAADRDVPVTYDYPAIIQVWHDGGERGSGIKRHQPPPKLPGRLILKLTLK